MRSRVLEHRLGRGRRPRDSIARNGPALSETPARLIVFLETLVLVLELGVVLERTEIAPFVQLSNASPRLLLVFNLLLAADHFVTRRRVSVELIVRHVCVIGAANRAE